MIERHADLVRVRTALRRSRVVALLGPRQCGKTTLARQFVSADSLNYFDLEEVRSLARVGVVPLADLVAQSPDPSRRRKRGG